MPSFAYTDYYKQPLCYVGLFQTTKIQGEVYEQMVEAFSVVKGSVSVSHGNILNMSQDTNSCTVCL
jgi:hypothetical protein